MATSRTVPGRRISKTEGLDRPSLDHFAKKSSSFSKINPQSIELRIFFIKFLKLNWNQPAASQARRRALHRPLRPPACTPRLPRSLPRRSGFRLATTSRHLANPPSRPPPAAPGSPNGPLAPSAPLPRGAPQLAEAVTGACAGSQTMAPGPRAARLSPRRGGSREPAEPSACRSARRPPPFASLLELQPAAQAFSWPRRSGTSLAHHRALDSEQTAGQKLAISWSFLNARRTTRAG